MITKTIQKRPMIYVITILVALCTASLHCTTFEQLFKRANQLFIESSYDEAITLYKQALELNPTCPEVFFNMGQSFYWSKKYPEALKAYQQTIKHKKDHLRAYTQMGKLLLDVRQPNDAVTPLQKALSLEPTNTNARLLLARAYNEQHLFTQAMDTVNQGLALEPDHINLTFELGNIYNTVNRLDEALEIYKRLDERAPNNPAIIYNIAFTLKKMGDLESSLPYYNRVLELDPEHTEALFSRGLGYLVIGDFEKGWAGYEWRYGCPSQGSLRSYTEPRWDGSTLAGKTILLHAEQGLGDTFQFIRYAKLIKEKGGKIVVAVQKPLVTLLCLCPFIDTVISLDETPPAFDVQASLLSLPYIVKTTLETIPTDIPYLYADEERMNYWEKQLANDTNFKIGICWQGNDNYSTPLLRTAVALKSIHVNQLAPLCTIPGVSIYSLQKTTGTDQLNELSPDVQIITFDEHFDKTHGRFMDTAAVMKKLDLIITIDTSICHLSSALGVPTWVMLPTPPDWRWMLNRDDSPWYPTTMRLFRQPTPGDWNAVIADVTQELKKLLKESKK